MGKKKMILFANYTAAKDKDFILFSFQIQMAPAFPVVVATVTTFSPREFGEAICAHSGDKEDCNSVFIITDLHITCKLSHPDLLNKNMNID